MMSYPASPSGSDAPVWSPDDAAELEGILADNLALEGPLLPILHAVQGRFGHVPEGARPAIAEALNITQAELHGVISFYHDFRSAPAGRHVLKLCRAEACQAMGASKMSHSILTSLGLSWGETTPDGRLTVEAVYCLGLCATAPAALIDGQVRGRITAQSVLAEVAP